MRAGSKATARRTQQTRKLVRGAMRKPTPPRRRGDLYIERLGAEVCLYDATALRAHALNRMAVQVWTLCDGTRDAGALAERLAETVSGLTPETAAGVVGLALEQCQRAGLLQAAPASVPPVAPGLTRRALLELGVSAPAPSGGLLLGVREGW